MYSAFAFYTSPFPRSATTSWVLASSGEPDSAGVVLFGRVGRPRTSNEAFMFLVGEKFVVKKVILF